MPHRIATQLFTFRHQLADDPQHVLDRVAEIGFTAVEAVYSITGGLSPAEQRRALDARGLTACAVHAFYDELSGDPDAVFAAARELGAEHVVCAWLDAEERRDAAGYERVARRLGELGERCAGQGLRLPPPHPRPQRPNPP